MIQMNICTQCDLNGHVDDKDDTETDKVCVASVKQKVIRYPGDIKRSDFSDPVRSEQAHETMKKHLKRSNTRNHQLIVKLARVNAQLDKLTKDYKAIDRQPEVSHLYNVYTKKLSSYKQALRKGERISA